MTLQFTLLWRGLDSHTSVCLDVTSEPIVAINSFILSVDETVIFILKSPQIIIP